jgi:flagella basal body P-ring formation protein FlgA
MRVLLAFLFMLPITAGEVGVALRPLVSVAAEHATLGDIADLSGDAALIAALRDLPVVELPDLRARRVDPDGVRQAIGLGLGRSLQVSGASEVSRSGQVIPETDLIAAATAAIPTNNDELTITTLRSGGAVTIPAGGAEPRIVAEALDAALIGDIPLRVRVLRGESEQARSLVTLRVVRHRTMLVAARALKRGERIGAGDVRSDRIVVTRGNLAGLAEDEVIGREARMDLLEGSPFVAKSVIAPPDVRVGQNVVLVVTTERFHLTAKGEALNDGRIGDAIAVRRSADGRTVRGTVIAEGQVRLDH